MQKWINTILINLVYTLAFTNFNQYMPLALIKTKLNYIKSKQLLHTLKQHDRKLD